MAKGFFIVVFEKKQDRNKIMSDYHWDCDDKHTLMLKPWHPTFNLAIEVFERVPIWVRLPNLPLQFWFESCLEVVGNSLGSFLMVDEGSSNLLHSTDAHILVEMEISKVPSEVIQHKTSKGCWVQPLDYEGVPFRCRICYQTGHVAEECAKHRKKKSTSWWKDMTPQHYTVEKQVEKLVNS